MQALVGGRDWCKWVLSRPTHHCLSRWEGEPGSVAEMGMVASGPRAGETVVRIDPKYFRPAEARAWAFVFRVACTCCMQCTAGLPAVKQYVHTGRVIEKGFSSAKPWRWAC